MPWRLLIIFVTNFSLVYFEFVNSKLILIFTLWNSTLSQLSNSHLCPTKLHQVDPWNSTLSQLSDSRLAAYEIPTILSQLSNNHLCLTKLHLVHTIKYQLFLCPINNSIIFNFFYSRLIPNVLHPMRLQAPCSNLLMVVHSSL